MERHCRKCGKKYVTDDEDFKYCSAECLFQKLSNGAQPKRPTKEFKSFWKGSDKIEDDQRECLSCNKPFVAKENWMKYCSKLCSDTKKIEKECKNCGCKFKTDQEWRTFCGRECYDEYRMK